MNGSYVGKPCPKCKYVRAVHESAPDWQCPKCGIAYAKFLEAQSAPEVGTAAHRAGGGAAVLRPAGQSYTLAVFAHLSILLGLFLPLISIVVPVVIWQTKKGVDDFAADAAKEAINFQLSFLLWCVGLGFGALACILAPPLIYLVGLLFVIVLLAYLILPIVAAIKVGGGDSYTYPFIKHFIE